MPTMAYRRLRGVAQLSESWLERAVCRVSTPCCRMLFALHVVLALHVGLECGAAAHAAPVLLLSLCISNCSDSHRPAVQRACANTNRPQGLQIRVTLLCFCMHAFSAGWQVVCGSPLTAAAGGSLPQCVSAVQTTNSTLMLDCLAAEPQEAAHSRRQLFVTYVAHLSVCFSKLMTNKKVQHMPGDLAPLSAHILGILSSNHTQTTHTIVHKTAQCNCARQQVS
jgi:hypothetical protein